MHANLSGRCVSCGFAMNRPAEAFVTVDRGMAVVHTCTHRQPAITLHYHYGHTFPCNKYRCFGQSIHCLQ